MESERVDKQCNASKKQKQKHLKKQKQFSVAGLQPGFQLQDCNQYFWGVAFSQFWAQNTSDLLRGYSPSRFFTSQNKIIKIKLGSKGPGTKAGVVYSVYNSLHYIA